MRGAIRLLGELLEMAAEQRLDRLANELREGRIGGPGPARRVEDDHAVARGVEVVPEVERHRGVGRRQPRRGGGNRRHD